MAPVIINEPHDKVPLKVSEWDEYEFIDHQSGIIYREQKDNFGPADITLLFTLALNERKTEGVLIVEGLNNDGDVDGCIGNVKFSILTDPAHPDLEGGAQIESVYIDADYRAMGIALSSYEIILNHFNVISDTHQTIDGAVFWKFKLVKQEHIDVKILKGFPDEVSVMHDDNGDDEVFTIDKVHLEPLIWGVENNSSIEREHITYGYSTGYDKIVLVAKKRN